MDSELQISHFNLERNDRQSGKKGGGLLTYIHESLIYTKIVEISNSETQLEQLWITANQPKGGKFIVGNIYRPPNENHKASLDTLKKTLQGLSNKPEVYILGDFNINMAATNNTATKDLNWLLHTLNMVQHVKSSTRVAESTRSIIDLIVSTRSEKVQEVSTALSTISDHYLVYINIKKSKTATKKVKVKGRIYKNFTKDAYRDLLAESDLNQVLNEKDPIKSWDILHEVLVHTLDKIAPVTEMKVTQNPPPWMDRETRELIKQKNQALKQAHNTNRKEDWIAARTKRNDINKQIRAKKKCYILKETLSKCPKRIWSAIRKLIPGEKTMQVIQAIKTQEKEITDPLEIATTFNDYFSTVGQNLAAQITKDKQYVKPEIQEPNTSLEIPRVTPVIIGKYIDKLPKNKSSGLKDLPIKAVKAAKDSISICLSHIINNIFEQCKITQKWKAAIITPIHKGGLKETVSNYRPISVLPFMDKLLERVIKDNLMTHLEGQKCLTENQGGYRKNYSTITMTRKLVDHILNNREDKIPTVAVFIDLSKAFDTISHKGLITKLQKYGIKNDVLNLLKDYLSHRTQQTSINGTLSQPREITFLESLRVSLLGPIFFLLFINDMEKVIKHSHICLFADDTVLYNSNINKETMELELQEDLTSLSRWLNNNELTINVKKSKVMTFSTHSRKIDGINLGINGQILDTVDTYKYLGLIVDNKLSFQNHIYYVSR